MNSYITKRRDCYWELASVSDAELQEWEQALRRELARPQREFRLIRREIKRRKTKHDNGQLAWLLGGDEAVVVRCIDLCCDAPVGEEEPT
jgi:hypothetical protein